jgi:diguanylate cyclase (GGDEF)-like protein/PAS domain S-box-containing protein
MIATSLLFQMSTSQRVKRVFPAMAVTIGVVVLGVVSIFFIVTELHERLPVLYQPGTPLTTAFYTVGGISAAVTTISLMMTVPHVLKRSLLHIWIAMVLLALLADVGASLSSYARYTVGWYFGRIEAMLASSVLLAVLLADVNRLYRNIAATAHDLSATNKEKDALLAEVRRREQEFEALAERAPDIIARIDRTRRVRYINTAVEQLTGVPREWFRGKCVAELGLSPKEKELREKALHQVFASGQDLILEHEYNMPSETRYFHARLAPEIGADGEVASVLVMERDITDLKKALFELEALTLHDPLTGIANRRYLAQFIEREWRLEARHRHIAALIMADVDHFKAYNDYYGHPRGDACLRQIAQELQEQVRRPGDLLARYGGEEFVVVLLETDLSAAIELAEAMCHAVAARQLPHVVSPVAPMVTVSLGVAAAPAHLMTFPELLRVADQALYRAKQKGRNRVEAAQPSAVDT